MLRFYFLGDDLDDLEAVSSQLQAAGIAAEQIYVVTDSYDEVDRRNFNHVWSVARKDTVRSAIIGAVVGVCLAALVLALAWASGIAESYTWTPFVFLAVVLLGFSTWEGGLWGIQEPHHEFKQFQSELENGRHLLLVEASRAQSAALDSVCQNNPRLTPVGEGKAVPAFMRLGHILFNRYRAWGP